MFRTHLPLLRVQGQQVLRLLLVAHTKIILRAVAGSVQSLVPLALLLCVLVMFLKREVVYGATDMGEIRLPRGEQPALDQSCSSLSRAVNEICLITHARQTCSTPRAPSSSQVEA